MSKFLCICLSSTIQRSINFKNVVLEKVNRSTSYRMDASGKAVNSARVLNQLEKGCVDLICPLGEKNKDLFLELAEKDFLNLKYVTIPGFTRECWTLLDREKETTTELVVGEPSFEKPITEEENELLNIIRENIHSCDGVLFAGSRPSYFSDGIVALIAKMAVDEGKFFLADYHGSDLVKTLEVCVPSAIKINEEEYIETFDNDADSEEKLMASLKRKSQELNTIIVVTRGVKSTYASDKGSFEELPTEKVRPVNTTACGDSFSAGFIYEYLKSKNLHESLMKGTWCAARNAESEVPGSIHS